MNEWTKSGYVQCRKDRRELVNLLSTQRERIAALEAENWALGEFVAVSRELDAFGTVTEDSPTELIERWTGVAERYARINHRLSTEFGLPLPEVER